MRLVYGNRPGGSRPPPDGPVHPYFLWHSADDSFGALIRPPASFSPSGSRYSRPLESPRESSYPMTWALKMSAASEAALNQWMLSLWAFT
ncbi:MAG: hypothetical protein K2X87_17460 [Gemmataceae bacterium]|nr:hypothetical protein [Gemmataceae bacterium]